MDTDYNDLIDLEDVALFLLRALRSVMSDEDQRRLLVDELDAEQEPGISLEIMERLAKEYKPSIPDEYKRVIEEEFGYTF